MESGYNQDLKYLTSLRNTVGNNIDSMYSYETNCLDFMLYHQLISYQLNYRGPHSHDKVHKISKYIKHSTTPIVKHMVYHTYNSVNVLHRSL